MVDRACDPHILAEGHRPDRLIAWSARLAGAGALKNPSAACDVTDRAETGRVAVVSGTADHRVDWTKIIELVRDLGYHLDDYELALA